MKRYIAVAGNIGVGKSTLVEMLCKRLEWEPFYEPVGENPYLEDFYHDMNAWAFHSQIFFLTNRLRANLKLLSHPTSVVQDRTVYEDAEIFARNLYEQKQISERDFLAYNELYTLITELLSPPDLVIYLRATVPTLHDRIASRGRDFESNISSEYLQKLNHLYEGWIDGFTFCPVLTVPADDINYVDNPGHLDLIVSKTMDKLMGKEEVIFSKDELENSK
ncbi:MAG: deoxynucleoside kinase [Anaerolineales bacterium]|nr:deoxynucleoside kinase [Anaerolineales bacterium]